MIEFFKGLFAGVVIVAVVDVLYYIKFLNMEKRFKQREQETLNNVKKFLEKHKEEK